MMILCSQQEMICYNDQIPLTGHFISYRGSMINWCPIGRNANQKQRQEFVKLNASVKPSLRKKELDKINYKINLKCNNRVTVKLGGETSFDIFPNGWDKTYALKHFTNYTCWFVGDRCGRDGNDKEIYDLLQKENRSFWTKDTKHTSQIIDQIIERIKNHE